MMSSRFVLVALAISLQLLHFVAGGYEVYISTNGPIVRGGSITFQAEVFHSDGSRPEGEFYFDWSDNTLPPHSYKDTTSQPNSTWNVTYSSNFFPGEYEVQVNVEKQSFFWRPICSRRTTFNITNFLNGEMQLTQNNKNLIHPNFVSNATPVQHKIALLEADSNFLRNATEVATHWFVDCVYYGKTEDLTFNYTYGTAGGNHSVEALVVVSFEPIVTTTTSTTTSTTTTTTTTSTTTTSTTPSSTTSTTSTSTTVSPTTTSTSTLALNLNEVSRSASNELKSKSLSHIQVPYVCMNSSIIPPDPKKTYGYFLHQVSVKAPIQNISIKGTDWLQPFALLDLQVECHGSGPFKFCDLKRDVNYNVTGNEVCFKETVSETCQYNVSSIYSRENYTIIIIISNDVTKIVNPMKIHLYQVQKHAQLSVIVVPVVCCLVVVILIVFGVAYYVERRKRFTVEVADFDFGQIGGDMEYKTFSERLRESVANSLNRDFGVDGEGNVWSPSRKYGSMQ